MGDLRILITVTACFTLSGFAALLYQTAWLRQFSIVFGTSELAVAAVLAAYMGGLALGAAVAGRFVHRIARPVLTYGVLEAGVAIAALCVPLLMGAAAAVLRYTLGHQPLPAAGAGFVQPAFYVVSTFIIIAIPTGLMGATLPILIRHAVTRDEQIGPRTGLLYAMNTAGAVAGTLVTGFILLPALGLQRTVVVGIAVNVIVFVIAATLSKQVTSPDEAAQQNKLTPAAWTPLQWILPIILLSGANAFFYEVLWSRLLTHAIGGSIHAFATMLASFLTGIALGGGLAGRYASSRERAVMLFAAAQVAIAGCSALVYFWLQHQVPAEGGLRENALLAVITMLPATIFIGATFPLAVRIFAASKEVASHSTARVYSWNTVGAIVGAIAAGYYLIPALDFSGSIKLAVAVNLLLALSCLLLLGTKQKKSIATLAVSLVLLLAFYSPSRPDAVVTASAVISEAAGEELFYAVGRSATVLVLDQDDGFYLRSNGLPEAQIVRRGMPPKTLTQSWLTALPVLARPKAESLLLIGLGGGVALEHVPQRLRIIDVVELEPEIVTANEMLGADRRNDPLQDPRVRVVLNDARNAMQLSNRRYDIIVSQPSHPWTAGASHLYTREFMQIASERLNAEGVFVQWMSTEFIDDRLLRSLAATLASVFEETRLYRPSPDVMVFLASAKALEVEREFLNGDDLAFPREYSAFGLNAVEDLLASLALSTDGLTALGDGVPPNTDDMNRLATSLISIEGLSEEKLGNMIGPLDPLTSDEYLVPTPGTRSINHEYLGYRLLLSGFGERALKLAGAVGPSSGNVILGLAAMLDGSPARAEQLFLQALVEDGSNTQAQYALLRPHLTALARETATPELTRISQALTGSAAATVAGWRHAIAANWTKLVDLDAGLAKAETTDLWFPEAARLRAELRLRGAGTDERQVREALQIVDQALALYELEGLLLLRAEIALRLRDAHAFVETALAFEPFQKERRQDRDVSATTRQQARWFVDRLTMPFLDPVRRRADAVTARISKLASRPE